MHISKNRVADFFKRADSLLLALCTAATLFGIIAISSAAKSYSGGSASYVMIQFLSLILGLFAYAIFTIIDIDIIADHWKLLVFFNVALLLALIPLGVADDTGNKAWIRFMGIGIQPAEVVKVVYIIINARHISYLKQYKSLSSPISLLQLALHFLLLFGLIVGISKDLGSALIYILIFAVSLFVSGVKLYWFAIGIAGVAAATPLLWDKFLREDQKLRIMAPYDPTIDPDGFGIKWQTNNSKLALASGQLTGTGLYEGTQSQSSALPAKHTDFIFSVIGEEFGMIGCLIVIGLLTAIIIRCVYIGIKSRNLTGLLVCVGVASTMTAQLFINIGMTMGIVPVIGVTLPFFSYGGTSIVTMFVAMGLVSGIKYKPKPERFRQY
ncbi:FtsW/RodA/SpoVE family cell cycle protein [Clostridiaceae bacterium OttesenSCG-928-D20]|nr:FtsW/RodA/SpoVE family cell cycle protein [Clostridiaceae bacterium OttesenSCG-928-D20]